MYYCIMRSKKSYSSIIYFILSIILVESSFAQINRPEEEKELLSVKISDNVLPYLKIEVSKVALINAKVIDGTGAPIKEQQTILIEGEKIREIGPSRFIKIANDYQVIDLAGKSVIPGIVGTHNHMRLPNAAMLYTSPRLYLACGVTTIQTCGTINPNEEIAIGKAINEGKLPGPEIINSSPYFTGANGKQNFIRFTNEESIRDTIQYWANRGVKWFKVYRKTNPQELEIIINEAHKNNAKVTGHLCATTYQEAAELGIDAIEHGFIHSYDHAEGKDTGTCSGSRDFRSDLAINSREVRQVHQSLIDNNVALSTTLAIFETQARGKADKRSLKAMAPIHRSAYDDWQKRKTGKGEDWYFKKEWLIKSMQYDLAFFKAGGLLTAGLDPGLHNMPGYGDQKNYELLIEAGFKPNQAIQVMTSNGAKLLGRTNIGKIRAGMQADLVVLAGDLETDPRIIREVEVVFKKGKGYDPQKLINDVNGHVGSSIDNNMTYLGQKAPDSVPQIFAHNTISKPFQHEFGSVFSKKGDEFFYGVDRGERSEILYSKLINGVWSEPETILSHDTYSFNDPMLSPNEELLYFISNRPLAKRGNKKDIDIWYLDRTKSGWGSPINAGKQINTSSNEYYLSITDAGDMYFASNVHAEENKSHNFDLYKSDLIDGKFQKPTKLPKAINSDHYEADVFIAPDESYIIFCSIRKGGYGQGDLYISFKKDDGTWRQAKNMGNLINNEYHQLCPFVTKDGLYLFFTSNQDIYWVSTEIIEHFRNEKRQ